MKRFRFSNKVQSMNMQVVVLTFIIVTLLGFIFVQQNSIDIAKEEVLIRIETNLRSGTVRKAWEVPNSFVYGFALTIVQKINNWNDNGSKEYNKNIVSLQNYITPSCRAILNEDFKKKKISGQLQERQRTITELAGIGFDEGNTRLVRRGVWHVDLSLKVREYIGNQLIKEKDVFWPLKVVEFNIDSEKNPQGLAIDCFYQKTVVLRDHKV